MGLGLHGGGLATVRYLVERGARCTVTDLRSENDLRPSLQHLPSEVRLVLGRHEVADFEQADLVVKNPAVPRHVPILRHARAITTDIALFLAERPPESPLIAITGTKGKSTTAGAAAHLLSTHPAGVRLGGNITISPLSFVNDLDPNTVVVLELSSFQLGDLRFCREHNGVAPEPPSPTSPILFPVLRPRVAIITSIFRDHQDYYRSMDAYIDDKRWIFREMPEDGLCVFDGSEWGRRFADEARAFGVEPDRIVNVGTEVPEGYGPELPEQLRLDGDHMRHNLAMATIAAHHCGAEAEAIVAAARTFPGVPHRMEHLGRRDIGGRGTTFINDTAATIPEASLAAIESVSAAHPDDGLVLIAGGTDKDLDLAPLSKAIELVHDRGGTTILLAGTATDRLLECAPHIRELAIGPFNEFEPAVRRALAAAETEREAIVILSPGCASFGMFKNEFDRGDRFRALLRPLLDEPTDGIERS